MANAPKCRSLTDLITCCICLERFKSPRTLPCMHTFCLECLERCLKTKMNIHELECALCKRRLRFNDMNDVRALPIDHMISQIYDLVDADQKTANIIKEQTTKLCELCKIKQSSDVIPNAIKRCQKCKLSFCQECSLRHDTNPLFTAHISFDLRDSSIFCKDHFDSVVEYYCKNCQLLMCTICVLEHDTTHKLEHWDEVLLSKCEKELGETMKMASQKSQEIKSHIKKLETLRQTYLESLFFTQTRIKTKANDLVTVIREREKKLLAECQNKFENIFKEVGLDVIADLKFNQDRIDLLQEEISFTLQDNNKLKCLFAFQNISKFKNIIQNFSIDNLAKFPLSPSSSSSSLSSGRLRTMIKTICFLPETINENSILIGTLQECNVHSVVDDAKNYDFTSSPSSTSSDSSGDPLSNHKRMKLILNSIDKIGYKKESNKGHGKIKSQFSSPGDFGDLGNSSTASSSGSVDTKSHSNSFKIYTVRKKPTSCSGSYELDMNSYRLTKLKREMIPDFIQQAISFKDFLQNGDGSH